MNTTSSSNTGIEERYRARLSNIPAPGTGCHGALLGVATLGIMAGRDDIQLLSDISANIPAGSRKATTREINDAIKRAHMDTAPRGDGSTWQPTPRNRHDDQISEKLKDSEVKTELQSRTIAAGGGELHPDDADVWESSPIKLHHSVENDAAVLLENLYQPSDELFIGNLYDCGREHVQTAGTWSKFFRNAVARIQAQPADRRLELFARLGDRYPLIMPNPLSGLPAPTATGDKMTFRGDNNVKNFRYILAEFDGLPLERQGGMLRGLCRQYDFRIAALIFSGKRSCHAWIMAEGIETREAWDATIKGKLFPILGALGADSVCNNPSRLSRLPGVLRRETGNWQRLQWLAPEGGAL